MRFSETSDATFFIAERHSSLFARLVGKAAVPVAPAARAASYAKMYAKVSNSLKTLCILV